MQSKSIRFWEVDCLRGLAVLMMIIYHFLVDLELVSGAFMNLTSGFWGGFQQLTASLFLVIAGISLGLSYHHNQEKGTLFFMDYFKRGIKIFSWGLLITFITRWLFSASYVVFGILHLIGLVIMFVFPLLRFKWLNLLAGMAIVLAGLYLSRFTFPFSTLLWLGFTPRFFNSFDYFPLLPWSGWILIGVFFGKLLYPQNQRRFSLPPYAPWPPARWLCAIGRHSLFIYLLHQPVLMAGILVSFRLWQP